MRVIKDQNKMRALLCSWVTRCKKSILYKFIYTINIIPTEISVSFCIETDKLKLKLKWKCKEPRVAKSIIKKKLRKLTLPDFKTF